MEDKYISKAFAVEFDGRIFPIYITDRVDVIDGVPMYEGILDKYAAMISVMKNDLMPLNLSEGEVLKFIKKAEKWLKNSRKGKGVQSVTFGDKCQITKGVLAGYRCELYADPSDEAVVVDILDKNGEQITSAYIITNILSPMIA